MASVIFARIELQFKLSSKCRFTSTPLLGSLTVFHHAQFHSESALSRPWGIGLRLTGCKQKKRSVENAAWCAVNPDSVNGNCYSGRHTPVT